MDNKIFFQHYELAINNLVTGIPCINEDHEIMHPFVNFEKNTTRYECLQCNYIIRPGILMWNALNAEIIKAQQQSDKELTNDT
jgi:hypothetical protein